MHVYPVMLIKHNIVSPGCHSQSQQKVMINFTKLKNYKFTFRTPEMPTAPF